MDSCLGLVEVSGFCWALCLPVFAWAAAAAAAADVGSMGL